MAFVTRTIFTLYFGSRGSFLLSVKNADLGMLCVKLYIIIPAVHKGKLSAILHCNKMLHNFVTYCGFSEYKLLVVSKWLLLLTLCALGNFSCFCCRLLTFFKIIFFFKKSFRNTVRLSNCLDPDQDRHSVVLIRVQTVCKNYQQTTAGSRKSFNLLKLSLVTSRLV